MNYIIFTSGGNDSLALTEWAHQKGLKNVVVAYSNTQWGADFWEERMVNVKAWVESLGFEFIEIASEGMPALLKRKRALLKGKDNG